MSLAFPLAVAVVLFQADVALSLCEVDHHSPDMDPTSRAIFQVNGQLSNYAEYRTKRSPRPQTPKPKVNLNSLKSNEVNVACRKDMKNLAELSKKLKAAKKSVNLLMLKSIIKDGSEQFPAKYFKRFAVSPKALLIRDYCGEKPLKIDENAFVGFGERLRELTIIGRCEVKSLSGIRQLKSLRSLVLSTNFGKIRKDDFSRLKNLRHLEFRHLYDIESTPIRSNAFELLKKLKFLSIERYEEKGDDYLTDPILKAVNNVPSLRELHMYFPYMEWKSGALNNLVNLKKFRPYGAAESTLKKGMFDGLLSLTHLVLDNANIEAIEPGALRDLHKLQKLDFSRNAIKKLPPDLLSPAPELRELYLNYNQLKTISPSLLASVPNLETLDLSNNPYKCDRDIAQLVDWVKKKRNSRWYSFELKNVEDMLCNGMPIIVKKCEYFYRNSRESEWAPGRLEPLK